MEIIYILVIIINVYLKFFKINFETNKIFLKACMTTKDGKIMIKKIKAFYCVKLIYLNVKLFPKVKRVYHCLFIGTSRVSETPELNVNLR